MPSGELQRKKSAASIDAELLSEAIAHLGEGILITNDHLDWPGPHILFVNEALTRITGYSANELIGQSPRILQGELTDRGVLDHVRRELSAGRSCRAEIVNYRKDGTPYDVEMFITPIFNADGRRTNFVSIHRDVTRRNRTQKAHIESEERMRAILSTAVDTIITIDRQGIIDSANPTSERMFGYTQDELIGQNVKILMPSPYREEHDGYLERYLETGEAKIIGIGREVVARRKDGSTFPVDLAVSEIAHLGLFTGIIRDITDRVETRNKLLQSERLAGLGEAMAGMAHESRNALQRSQVCLDLLMQQHGDNEESLEFLLPMQKALDDLNCLLERVRLYAAPIQLNLQYHDVGEVLRSAWDDVRSAFSGREMSLVERPGVTTCTAGSTCLPWGRSSEIFWITRSRPAAILWKLKFDLATFPVKKGLCSPSPFATTVQASVRNSSSTYSNRFTRPNPKVRGWAWPLRVE